MCQFFGISRAAYYAWAKKLDQPDPDQGRVEQVREAYGKSHRTYGYWRITLWLQKQKGICNHHKAVLRLMNKLNIRSVARQRKIFAGQLNRAWAYLSTIQDQFDGFLVSHCLGRENSLSLVLKTLKQATQRERIIGELLLHSDHGYQYTSHGYAQLTAHYAITPSVSRRGNCWDNARMESFFSHLKAEVLHSYRP